ncbi:MAG: NAD(P)/FAD-dependent oxidoreductase [Bacillota bacterium]
MNSFDVVIIGSGVIGLSIAYHLSLDNSLKVAVVDREKFPCAGSTAQCTGGIRHQFSNPVCVTMTKISLPYFKRFNADMEYPVYFRQRGYLFVSAKEENRPLFINNTRLLDDFGIPAYFFSPAELAARYPFLHSEDLIGGTYCPEDGYADPYGVTMGYFNQARKRGVQAFFQEEVTGVDVQGGAVKGIITSKRRINCGVLVNAAGPDLPGIGRMAGIDIPARPYRRQVYVCSPLGGIPGSTPLVVDLDTGFYLHAEKNGILLLGGTDRDTYPGTDTSVDWSLLDGFIEAAVGRIPALQEGSLEKAYVGIRSLTPDYLGLLGEHPAVKGFFIAGGFAGNGFMHSPAIGIISSQLILRGSCDLLDTSPLSPARVLSGSKAEKNIF